MNVTPDSPVLSDLAFEVMESSRPALPEESAFSARRVLWLGFGSLFMLTGGLLGWGLLASISGAVVADGQVETEGGEQAVEHVDGGTVAEIRVRDGDTVRAGETLVRIDGASLEAEVGVLEAERVDLIARRNRLEAEARDLEVVAWDTELTRMAARDPAIQSVLDGHQQLFEARQASQKGLVKQLEERIGQTRKQIAGIEAQSRALVRQNELVVEELDAKESLFKKGFGVLPEVLSLKRGMAYLEGQTGEMEAQAASAWGQIAEIQAQILQIRAERMEQAEAEARQAQARENIVRERLRGLREQIGRLEVRAPVAGLVHDLSVSAEGEVLQPGEPVAKVVPGDAGLLVRVRVAPTDVDQVWPGQPTVLRFSAFQARETSQYEGEVRRISADALTDERNGLSWYEAEIAIGQPVGTDSDATDAASLALAPGMPVEVYLQTGERSPLSWLVKPLTDHFTRALREE